MAKKVLTPLDLDKNELQNARIHNLASAPSSPANGQVYFDTVTKTIYFWDSVGWVDVAGAGGSSALTDLTDVTISTPAEWEFLQKSSTDWVNRTAEEAGVMTFHGFVFPYEVTLSYNESTRVTTITPTGATFDVWIQGKKHTKTGAQTFTHSAVSGDHFIYYDATGTLVESSTPWDFKNVCPVAYVYYNATSSIGWALFELHGYKRNLEWHESQHFAIGTFVKSGLSISGYTLNTTTNAAVTPAFASGVIVDEDIEWDVGAVADGGPYTIVNRTGATLYTWTTANTFPYRYGATYIQYNQFTGGVWQLTELATSQWVNYYVFASTAIDSNKRLYLVPGQAVYASLALAQAESVANLSLDGFGLTEFVPVYKLTFAALSTYTAVTGRARIVAVERILNTKGNLALTASSTLHNSLTGRSDADSHPTSAITGLDAALAAKGTVSSVALSMPSIFTVTGSPVTGSGTLTAALNTVAASGTSGQVFAGPVAGSAVPTFRTLVSADIPDLSYTKITNLSDALITSILGVQSTRIGFRSVPMGLSNAAKTLAQTDNGCGYYKNDTSAYTYTIPDGLEDGTIFTLANMGSAGNITISMSGSEVLRLAGTTTTGSRTVAPYSEATVHRVGGVWLCGGAGVT
jgi:hypothetical protein